MSSGWSRDALPRTPPSYTTELRQNIQQLDCTMFVPTHPIQETGENSLFSSFSNQQYHPFVSSHALGSYIQHQCSYSQSTSISPNPHYVRPHIHGENSWGVLPSPPPPTLLDTYPISAGSNVWCSHPQPEQVSKSRFPQSCAEVLASAPTDPCHPRGDSWWLHDSTFSNYLTSHLPQSLGDSELLYPPLLSTLLTAPLV